MTDSLTKKRIRRFIRAPRRLVRRIAGPLRKALRPPDYGALLKRIAHVERNLRNLLWAGHAGIGEDSDQRTSLRRSEFKVFSENGEDGLLLYLFSRIGTSNRRFVEFGIGDPEKCNSANLTLSFGWSGLLLDCGPGAVEAARRFYQAHAPVDPARVRVVERLLTPSNIDSVLRENGMEGEIDLLSIDIDSNDYWVWQAISAVSPRLVAIEYNASLGPDEPLVTVYADDFRRYEKHRFGWYHGASLAALAALGREKGYVLVGCDSTGLNAFFVRADAAKGRLRELSAREAYYPEARRLRVMSVEDQIQSLRHLEFVRV